MGFIKDFSNTFSNTINKLGEEYTDYEENEEYFDEPDEVESPKVKPLKSDNSDNEQPRRTSNNRGGMGRKKNSNMGDSMEVCVFKPTKFEDSQEIVDTLRKNIIVNLNVEGVDIGLAGRILDFAYGACYAINGDIQKISNFVFVITPPGVGVSGDVLNVDKSVFDV